ncbi:hypothetical protein NP233_g12247 [Leucocoprinus birnbaumii]|uniref:Uncharacterized protein n=1 Tax=Leucocoprinus birnbaumii TaxID=56174 RepID=A0AAD5VF05_9AGAR|nr:hypothetical protein NP233_g12247 [Leucocoprinus birnbaumii]
MTYLESHNLPHILLSLPSLPKLLYQNLISLINLLDLQPSLHGQTPQTSQLAWPHLTSSAFSTSLASSISSPFSTSVTTPSSSSSFCTDIAEYTGKNSTFKQAAGLDLLLRYPMPDAFHNAGACCHPFKCHPGARKDYITEITN